MEASQFFLDLLGTGAVLPCSEIQQDVDLQETDTNTTIRGEGQREQSGIQNVSYKEENKSTESAVGHKLTIKQTKYK